MEKPLKMNKILLKNAAVSVSLISIDPLRPIRMKQKNTYNQIGAHFVVDWLIKVKEKDRWFVMCELQAKNKEDD